MNQKWTVDIDEFKTYLGVSNKYSDFKDLEKRVLLPALKEIEENTDLRLDYKKIKIGRRIQKIEFEILNSLKDYRIPETLPEHIIKRVGLISLHDALVNIHYPKSFEMLKAAQFRLKLEELFFIQLGIVRTTKIRSKRFKGFLFSHIGHYFNTFYHDHIPFDLTQAQKRVLKEIRADVGSGKQMNRLLQGDVGSGKTLVALMSMLMAFDFVVFPILSDLHTFFFQ